MFQHISKQKTCAKKVSTHLVFICNSAEEPLAKGASYVLLDQKHITPQRTFTFLPILPPTQLDIYGNIVHKDSQR